MGNLFGSSLVSMVIPIAIEEETRGILRSIATGLSNLPWCIFDDFSDLLSQEDKIGIHDHPNWLIRGFRAVVFNSNLHDSPIEGY